MSFTAENPQIRPSPSQNSEENTIFLNLFSSKLDQKFVFMKNTKNKPPIFFPKLSKNAKSFKKKSKNVQDLANLIDTIQALIPNVSP